MDENEDRKIRSRAWKCLSRVSGNASGVNCCPLFDSKGKNSLNCHQKLLSLFPPETCILYVAFLVCIVNASFVGIWSLSSGNGQIYFSEERLFEAKSVLYHHLLSVC